MNSGYSSGHVIPYMPKKQWLQIHRKIHKIQLYQHGSLHWQSTSRLTSTSPQASNLSTQSTNCKKINDITTAFRKISGLFLTVRNVAIIGVIRLCKSWISTKTVLQNIFLVASAEATLLRKCICWANVESAKCRKV